MLPCHVSLAYLVSLLLQLLDKFKEIVTVYRTRDESVALYIGVAQVCLLMFTIVATLSIGWCVFLPAVSSLAVTKQRIGELVKRLPTKGVCRLGFSFVGGCVLTVLVAWQPIPVQLCAILLHAIANWTCFYVKTCHKTSCMVRCDAHCICIALLTVCCASAAQMT